MLAYNFSFIISQNFFAAQARANGWANIYLIRCCCEKKSAKKEETTPSLVSSSVLRASTVL